MGEWKKERKAVKTTTENYREEDCADLLKLYYILYNLTVR